MRWSPLLWAFAFLSLGNLQGAAPFTPGTMYHVPAVKIKVQGNQEDFRRPPVSVVVQDGKTIISNFPQYNSLSPFETATYDSGEPGFYIMKNAVTNREYREFVKATGHPAPAYWRNKKPVGDGFGDEPVVNVTHDDAAAYAAWVGRRLPSYSEYQRAERKYPSLRASPPYREWTSTPAGSSTGSYYVAGGPPTPPNQTDSQLGFRLASYE